MRLYDIDKIIILHYKPAIDRLPIIEHNIKVFNELGISDKVYIHISVPLPFFDKIANFHRLNIANGNLIDTSDTFYDLPNVFNCALNWYTIMKQHQNNGLNILCIEDDTIINDVDMFVHYILNCPKDCDILRISCDNIDYNYIEDVNNLYYKQIIRDNYTNWRCGSTACFLVNDNAINFYCNFVEHNGYFPADHPWMNIKGINAYIVKKCPVINKSIIHDIKTTLL